MSYGGDSHLFSAGAGLYADPLVRPNYPPKIFEHIYRFCGPSREAALDVATGTGQVAFELAKDFAKVIAFGVHNLLYSATTIYGPAIWMIIVYAIDANKDQLKQCKPGPNLEYQVACAEQTNRPDSSIDLVTVAAALHWFDQPEFYKEARRILKPHGSLAAWAYTIPQVKGNKEASDLLETFFKHTIGAYLSPAHKCYFAEYRGVEPQKTDFHTVERANVEFEKPSSVRLLVAFASTTSLMGNLRKQGREKDPLPQLQEDLLQATGSSDVDSPLTSVWPTFIILAKGPVPL